VYDNPTHGAKRISMNLAEGGTKISEGAIYSFMASENMNTKHRRVLWAQSQGRELLTDKQKAYLSAQYRHIDSCRPGELVGVDTFWVNIKNLGRVYQYTACDTYSSYGWAKLYKDRTSDNTVHFLKYHILEGSPKGKIKRIITDQGSEFYSARHQLRLDCLKDIYQEYNITHTITKKAHPWTNGYAERLNRTIWDEFYLCRLYKPFYTLEELQKELDLFMKDYNFNRIHTGYKLRERGYRYPCQAFFEYENDNDLPIKCYHLT